MLRDWWQRLSRVDAASNSGRFVFLCIIMGITTAINVVLAILMLNWVPILAALAGWVFVIAYGIFQSTALEKAGDGIGAIMVPSGSSTPSINQHSNIQALVARGAYAEAAEAYRAVIAAVPDDLVSCEQLAQLALRELKDYQLAIFAWREAEKRTTEPRRAAGYALLVAGVFRDQLKEPGRSVVELRRILDRYPAIPNAAALRAEIDELKAMHFEGQ